MKDRAPDSKVCYPGLTGQCLKHSIQYTNKMSSEEANVGWACWYE